MISLPGPLATDRHAALTLHRTSARACAGLREDPAQLAVHAFVLQRAIRQSRGERSIAREDGRGVEVLPESRAKATWDEVIIDEVGRCGRERRFRKMAYRRLARQPSRSRMCRCSGGLVPRLVPGPAATKHAFVHPRPEDRHRVMDQVPGQRVSQRRTGGAGLSLAPQPLARPVERGEGAAGAVPAACRQHRGRGHTGRRADRERRHDAVTATIGRTRLCVELLHVR